MPHPPPAKFAPFQMERFANAIMGPAKIAYLSDRREPERELNYKFKVLIRRMISSQMVSVTDIVA
jgi:hypothetical protein